MGVVYKARQESLGRLVALKVLPSFASMEASAVTRFRREAEAAGRLSHPGIVPVYGVGEASGVHFYAMELVEGPSLADLIDDLRGRLPGRLLGSLAEEAGIDGDYPALRDPPGDEEPGTRYARSCVAVVADIANALAAAHRGKIIHRDMKPSNVMIHRTGRPVLLDFGLARDEMAVGLTRSGDAVGTPSYMAPEQACGRKDLDARVDIYGLGALLYELLTLRPPYEGAHAGEIMRKILDQDPQPVRKLNPRVPADLETIVGMSLAKNPDDRYATAEALELDLRSFLIGRAVAARPKSSRQRVVQFLRRNRRAAMAAAVTLVVAGALGTTAGIVAKNRAAERGRTALGAARDALLNEENVAAAQELFGSATALLGDVEEVREARQNLAEDAFAKFYQVGKHGLLRAFFDSMPPAEREALQPLIVKVRGQGTVRLAWDTEEDAASARVEVRALQDGASRLEPDWRPLPAQGSLPMGDYLLRVQVDERASLLRMIHVERDGDTLVPTSLPLATDLPANMVMVSDPEGRAGRFAVAVGEVSRADYQRFLDSLDDANVRASMTPLGWTPPTARDAELPVIGLSFRQARAVAAHYDAHLLSAREFQLAATAGLDLDYPWGGDLNPAAVVADPDLHNEPEGVLARPIGASVVGVRNLMGNAAEILSTAAPSRVPVMGGHFQSEPAALVLSDPQLCEWLSGSSRSAARAGTRLARFLPGPAGMEVARMVAERLAEIRSGVASIVHHWTVDDAGAMKYRLGVSGIRGEQSVVHWPLVTTGFQQISDPTVADGHGARVPVVADVYPYREASRLQIQMPRSAQRGQSYRLDVDAWLRPLDGLSGAGDHFVLRLPVKATGDHTIVHHVQLPTRSRIEEVDPPESYRYVVNGRPHLMWEFRPDGAGRRTLPAVVRFRRDGNLSDHWATEAELEVHLREVLRAFGTRDAASLRRWLHPSFLLDPGGIDFRAALARPQEASRFIDALDVESLEIIDDTAVGAVVTVDAKVPWRMEIGERAEALEGWPLRAMLLRERGAYRTLRVKTRGRPDEGRIGVDGTYTHESLRVVLDSLPGLATLARTQDELVEMQVMFVNEQDDQVKVQVLGHRGVADRRPEVVTAFARHWLTGAAASLWPGRQLPAAVTFEIGPEDEQGRRTLPEECQEWLFGRRGQAWSRERWAFVRKGTRHFLIKCVATGEFPDKAEERFARSRGWFAKVAAAVRLL